MKSRLDCIPCFQRQALEATRFATGDEHVQEQVLREVIHSLSGLDWKVSPLELAYGVHGIVRRVSGENDPYSDVKRRCNDAALRMYPELRKMVDESSTPLLTAVRLAIAGNIIDLGMGTKFDIKKTVVSTLKKDFRIDDFSKFVRTLNNSTNITYLADNAGEIVFDKLLLETILKEYDIEKILFAVKGAPFINDATLEDAIYAGLDQLPGIKFIGVGIGNGSEIEYSSEKFADILAASDMVISKGQGNYEAFSSYKEIFFLLIAKCPVIARDIGVKVGDIILKYSSKK